MIKNKLSLREDGITQDYVNSLFDYDSDNGVLIRKFRNGKSYNKPCGYKPICNGYGRVKIDGKNYRTHLVIWLLVNGVYPDGELDHIDRDKTNNRIENLRDVSSSMNQHNRGVSKNNTSGFPGVVWNKKSEKYQVRIRVNNKRIHIGLFSSLEEAILASKLAKIKYHPSSPDAIRFTEELGIALTEELI